MKKLLLSVAALAVSGAVSAQLNGTGDGFTLDNGDATSQCLINSAPNHAGIMNGDGGSLTASSSTQTLTTSGYMTLTAAATVSAGNNATWFGLPAISGSGAAAQCLNLYGTAEYLDLSAAGTGKIAIDIEADAAGATLEVFLGGPGQWGPASSTYNIGDGSGIIASAVVTAANTPQTIVLDLEALDATVWGNWSAKNQIQSIGFRAAADGSSDGATFKITEIRIGTDVGVSTNDLAANGVSVFPNPVTNGILNFTENIESIQVFDMVGNLVATANNTNVVDMTGVNAGVYFVQTSLGNAKVIVK